jgi:hypothetical protein
MLLSLGGLLLNLRPCQRPCVDSGASWLRTFDAQVATHERLAHIDMFHFDLDFILLAIRGLAASEAAAGAEEGRGAVRYKLCSGQRSPEHSGQRRRGTTHSVSREWRD